MNYRHAYHAGNFADVLKHTVLARCLVHLRKKPAPFRVIDTHAGSGRTQLDGTAAMATREWQGGIGRLMGPEAVPLPSAVEQLLAPYLELVRAENTDGLLRFYPGSPLLARALLRGGDALVANEFHPEDAKVLRANLAMDTACKITSDDGYRVLKASLPPKERRGLILVDPPYEEPGELVRVTDALREGIARFATGTYLLWYPIKDEKPVARFHRAVHEIAVAAHLEAPLVVELLLRPVRNPLLLNGCGLLVVNAPFTLGNDLAIILPELADRLGEAGKGLFKLGPLGAHKTVSSPSVQSEVGGRRSPKRASKRDESMPKK